MTTARKRIEDESKLLADGEVDHVPGHRFYDEQPAPALKAKDGIEHARLTANALSQHRRDERFKGPRGETKLTLGDYAKHARDGYPFEVKEVPQRVIGPRGNVAFETKKPDYKPNNAVGGDPGNMPGTTTTAPGAFNSPDREKMVEAARAEYKASIGNAWRKRG